MRIAMNPKLHSAIVACDSKGRSPIKGASFTSTVSIAQSPRLTNALRAAATRARFNTKVLNQTLEFKMKTATQYLTQTLDSAKGRKTVLDVAKDLFKGDCNLAVSHLVGMLQTQVKNKHFAFVEDNMQSHPGSPILDPLCFPQPIDLAKNANASSSSSSSSSSSERDEDGDAFSATVSAPPSISTFHIGDEVSVRRRRRPAINLKDFVETKGTENDEEDSSSDGEGDMIGTVIRMDEMTEKILVLKHDSGYRHWYRVRHLKLLKKCPDAEAASKAGAGECLKHIDSFVWQTQMEILRDSPLQLTELQSKASGAAAGDWILATRQPVTKSPRIRRMNTAPPSCASPTKKRKTIRKSRSSAPSSTRALRNLSIISGSRVKALLRKKYHPESVALGKDVTPFESSDAFFRKRLLHASNPGISQWVHRHFQLKNNFLNVSMKSSGQLKYAGSYCLRDFSHISVVGQRIFCTFAIAADVKLILHARTQEAAAWFGRRLRLHQAYFMYNLPGITVTDAGAIVQKIQNNAPVASAPSKHDTRTAAASEIVANRSDLLGVTIGTPVTPITPTNKPSDCSTASDDDGDATDGYEEVVEEYCDDF